MQRERVHTMYARAAQAPPTSSLGDFQHQTLIPNGIYMYTSYYYQDTESIKKKGYTGTLKNIKQGYSMTRETCNIASARTEIEKRILIHNFIQADNVELLCHTDPLNCVWKISFIHYF